MPFGKQRRAVRSSQKSRRSERSRHSSLTSSRCPSSGRHSFQFSEDDFHSSSSSSPPTSNPEALDGLFNRNAGQHPKRVRRYTCYDRLGAAVSVPLPTPLSGTEALQRSTLLADDDEWQDASSSDDADAPAPSVPFHLEGLLASIEPHIGHVTAVAPYAAGVYHNVYVVRAQDQLYALRFDSVPEADGGSRLRREVATMHLARDAGVPVPEVVAYCAAESGTDGLGAWMLMRWVDGTDDPWAYLEEDAKEQHIRSLAEVMVATFHAPISDQKVGSIVAYDGKSCTVAPSDNLVGAATQCTAEYPVDLDSYLEWLCQRAIDSTAGADLSALSLYESAQLVARFRAMIAEAIKEAREGLSGEDLRTLDRIALVHGDADRNIICPIGSPAISAVIDFEFSLCLPALLAAPYPACISYDGIRDSRCHVADAFPGMIWPEHRDRTTHLRAVFEKAVEALSPAYSLALRRGQRLRDFAEWLVNWEHDDAFRSCAQSFVRRWERAAGRPMKISLSGARLGPLGL